MKIHGIPKFKCFCENQGLWKHESHKMWEFIGTHGIWRKFAILDSPHDFLYTNPAASGFPNSFQGSMGLIRKFPRAVSGGRVWEFSHCADFMILGREWISNIFMHSHGIPRISYGISCYPKNRNQWEHIFHWNMWKIIEIYGKSSRR